MALHFEGTQPINAPLEAVWRFINDPDSVASCAPGFKSMETLGPDHFKPTIAVGIGAIKATFTLDVERVDVQAPSHAAMIARGTAIGSAVELRSAMTLTANSATLTTMTWTADATVNGTIASVGARLMEGTARKLTNQFFDCLRQKVEAPVPIAPAPDSTTGP